MGDISYGFHKISTMDRTQSSENESLRANMSYLYGRDPSILAYGQRPFPSQESKKNLISLLEEEKNEDGMIESVDKVSTFLSTDSLAPQTIKVFLRMKPFPRKMKVSPEQEQAYSVLDPTTLLTKMPSLDSNTSCLKKIKPNEIVCRKFIFTRTFDAETTQLQLFEEAVKPQMVDFLAGKNSVVMSYGTTNSGKTYTLQGTAECPGIIPRGIEFVFSNISPRATPCYKPVNFCDVVYLSNHDRLMETDIKMKLLTFNTLDMKNFHVATYEHMQMLLHQESPMKSSHIHNAQYSVWISFAEIYNETIYDLLSNDSQKKRPSLKLATDNKGRAFIKGLKNVCVNSGAEAYQLLMTGQYNLKVAATALNSRSSRSHCIFTIKLLKYRNEYDTQSVEISTFAFCDLAGSERLKKTLNVGERLKEAQNINTSLLVLGRCLKTIYESQSAPKQKSESIGPFRESKLTRLFQRALSGKEQIALIVNVNPVPNLYVETQNVLNFSAIAKKIVLERNDVIKRRHSHSRFSRLVTQSIKTEMDWENTELQDMTEASEELHEQDSDTEEDDEAYEDLLIENEMLKKEIKELKASVLARDMQTRQEMTDMYTEMMKKLETDWKNRMTDMEEQQEDLREIAVERIEAFYKEKFNQLNTRKKSRSSISDEDEEDDKQLLEDFEVENTRLQAKIETLKKFIRDLKLGKETVESEKTKISFELAVAIEDVKRVNEMLSAAQKSIISGDDASGNYIEELSDIIKTKNERIKTLKTFLDDAKEEYIFITDQAQKLENTVKEQDEMLAEKNELIQDLEEQLVQANVHSEEQNKLVESLEEELEQQLKKLMEAEDKIKNISEITSNSLEGDKHFIAHNQEELTSTKSLLAEIKLRLEFSEKENLLLREKLNQRVDEIQALKNNLDSTKNQLDTVTEKVNNLTIDDINDDVVKQQIVPTTVEQEIQTDVVSSPIKGSSPVARSIANISCQTLYFETKSIETDEKCLQTSLCLDEPLIEKDIIDENIIKQETVSKEVFDELQKQFEEIREELRLCRIEKTEAPKQFENTIHDLQTRIAALSVIEEEKDQKIVSLQKDLEDLFTKYEKEKTDMQSLIKAQENKDKNVNEQMAKALAQEQDKDKEISSLQKEMKTLIQSNEETVKKMEVEMKNILKDLTNVKDQLTKTEERSRKMEKDYKQVIHILEMKVATIEQRSLEKQVESEKLKLRIEEMKKSLDDNDHEMEMFKRNREETVSRYEDLVKSQSDELERQKKEVTRLQDLLQEVKENTANPLYKGSTKKSRCNVREDRKKNKMVASDVTETSDDDYVEDSGTDKTKLKKKFLTPSIDNIPVIELSGSESKRSAKSGTNNPPTSTRSTRRKKLFTPLDESFVDIDQGGEVQNTRSLRNRRK